MVQYKHAQAAERASELLLKKIQKSKKEHQKVEMAKYVRENKEAEEA